MTIFARRPVWSVSALLALVGLGVLPWIAGCSTQPGLGDVPPEYQTASDETDVRKRAHTRLMLATSYYENGQYVVALDEQKKAVVADPAYADAYNLGGLSGIFFQKRVLNMRNRVMSMCKQPDGLPFTR